MKDTLPWTINPKCTWLQSGTSKIVHVCAQLVCTLALVKRNGRHAFVLQACLAQQSPVCTEDSFEALHVCMAG